jgi:outer membrane lipoprotein-sorting protein
VLRRVPALSLLLALACPMLALAAPGVKDIVVKAVQAVQTQCYEARMRFLSQIDGGTEQVVRIYHLAPDLYRVEPLVNGEPGSLAFIENGQELVRMRLGKNVIEQMPQRQFSLNDSLTVTFLRMLSSRNGTAVLKGMVGSYSVYVLRQDGKRQAPYTITVGVDQTTFYPVFLSVSDTRGRRLVYYEMEAIEFKQAHQLRDELFEIPKNANQRTIPAPHAGNQQQPGAPSPKSSARVPTARDVELPLYPTWLPTGYRVEAISVLSYTPADADSPVPVFQVEAYGPNNDLVSIFQTKSSGVSIKVSDTCNDSGCGFVMREHGGWVITVIGTLNTDRMLKIADQLGDNDQRVLQLLRQTRERDRILQQFASD